MHNKLKWITGLALAAGLTFAGSTAAYAGTTPTPTPSHPVVPTPTPTNWEFDVQQSHIGVVLPTDVNRVEGVGALPMDNWRDIANPNPAIDTFRRGLNSVTLLHSTLAGANLTTNPYTCTVNISQHGVFRIIAGTGTGARLTSRNGQFELDGMASFPLTRSGVCVLRLVSPGTILRAVQFGRPILGINPSFEDISVQGRALVTRTPVVIRPFLTPSASQSA